MDGGGPVVFLEVLVPRSIEIACVCACCARSAPSDARRSAERARPSAGLLLLLAQRLRELLVRARPASR